MASIFDQDPKTGLTGLETLLGNVVMPGQIGGKPTNKQMIDAAILRGSLELLKPRQAGENFASQASRALTAASEVTNQTGNAEKIDLMLKQLQLEEKLEGRIEETARKEGKTDFPEIGYSKEQQKVDEKIANAFGVSKSSSRAATNSSNSSGIELSV